MKRVPAAALAFALLGGANGCCSCGSQSGTFERFGAPADGTMPALEPPVLRVLHFGDFGSPTCQQAAVADGIAGAQHRAPFDLALHAGDNLYPCGPDWRSTEAARCTFAADGNTVVPGYVPPNDPSFGEKFEGALGALAAGGVPVYLALGNHDIRTTVSCVPVGDETAVARAKACLEVARTGPLWRMPARHYVIDAGPARFIVLDTNLVAGDYGGFTLQGEIDFLAESVVPCDARPCFVVAHHPPAAAGTHLTDFTPGYDARVDALAAAAGGRVRAWLNGHDHDLQHLRTAEGVDVFISGNGCEDRPGERFAEVAPAGATLLYGSVRWGYAVLEVSATGFTWRAEDDRGAPRYCCAASLSGGVWSPCNPVQCP